MSSIRMATDIKRLQTQVAELSQEVAELKELATAPEKTTVKKKGKNGSN